MVFYLIHALVLSPLGSDNMAIWPRLSTLGVDIFLGSLFIAVYFLRPLIKARLSRVDSRDSGDTDNDSVDSNEDKPVFRDAFTAKVPWRRPQQPPLKSLLVWALIAMWFVISGSLRPIVDISLSLASIVVPISISMQRSLGVLLGTLMWVIPSFGWLNSTPEFLPSTKLTRLPDTTDSDDSIVITPDVSITKPRIFRYGAKRAKGTFKPVKVGGSDWFTVQYKDFSQYFRWIWWTVGGYCISVFAVRLVDLALAHFFPVIMTSNSDLVEDVMTTLMHPENGSISAMLVGAFTPCVIGPIWEEFLFRGFLLPLFASVMPLQAATVLSAFLFAAQHGQWDAVLQLFALGYVWNRMYIDSKNLLVTIMVHIMWNSRSLLSALLCR